MSDFQFCVSIPGPLAFLDHTGAAWGPSCMGLPTTRISLHQRHKYNFIYFCSSFIYFFIFLQCCVGLCHTTWISHNHTYIPSLLSLPPIPSSYLSRSSQSARLGSLCYIATSHQLSILKHMIVYICQCYFLYLSHPLLPSLCPEVHSLHLCLHSFSANRLINTIFLDSIYMC